MHRSGRYASLREGLVGAWCPSVSGSFGYSLPDLSGYGNNGALTNMDPATDWVASGGKMALDFDGSNDYVNVGNASQLQITGKISCSCWFNARTFPTGKNQYKPLITKGYDGTKTSYQLNFQNDDNTGLQNALVWGSYSGAQFGTIYVYGGAIVTSTWYHVIGTYDAATWLLYVNGQQVASSANVNGPQSGSKPVSLGLFDIGGTLYNFDGALDDARIYNRALTRSEIQLLYTGGRGVGLIPERRRWFYSAVASLIDGSSASAITTIGSLGGSGALSGSASLAVTTAAAVAGAGLCAGSSSLQFEASGAIGGGSALTATTDLVIATTAAISGGQVISGTAALTFGSSGSTSGIGALDGSLAISIATDATIFATAAVSGSAALAVGISATLGGSALLSGSVALVSSATATPAGIDYASDAAWPSSIRATTWRQVRRSNLTTWAAKER